MQIAFAQHDLIKDAASWLYYFTMIMMTLSHLPWHQPQSHNERILGDCSRKCKNYQPLTVSQSVP